jgi:hypothetical protein
VIIIPQRPDSPDEDHLLAAVLVVAPASFGSRRPSLAAVAASLKDAERF